MKRKITVLTLCALLFALSVPAEAQQTTKGYRIGFLSPSFPPVLAARYETFRKACTTLGTWRGKTLSLSLDMRRENKIASPRSRPS